MPCRRDWNPDEFEAVLCERDKRGEFLSETKGSKSFWLRSMISFLSTFSGFDLYQCEKFHDCPTQHESMAVVERLARDEKVADAGYSSQSTGFQRGIRFLYCWINFRMICALVLQYIYDNHKLKRDRALNSLLLLTGSANETASLWPSRFPAGGKKDYQSRLASVSSVLGALNVSLAEDRRWIKLTGSPWLEFRLTAECGYFIILLLGLGLYSMFSLYHNYYRPANFSLFRLLLDREREKRNLNRMVIEEVDKIIASSYNFAQTQLDSVTKVSRRSYGMVAYNRHHQYRSLGPRLASMSGAIDGGRSEGDCTSTIIVTRHRRTVEFLKESLRSGKLEPINRDAKYLHKMTAFLLVSTIWFIGAFSVNTAFNVWILPYLYGEDTLEYAGFMDYLYSGEVSALAFFTCLWSTFELNIMTAYSIDFITIVGELCRQMNCLREESARKSCRLTRTETTNDPLDSPLILVHLQYRFFVRQLKVIRPLFSYYLTIASSVMVMVPLLLFVHYPYVRTGRRGLLFLAALYCFMGDLCTVPMCYMYARCADLYKLFFNLFAHMIKLKTSARTQLRGSSPTTIGHDIKRQQQEDLFSHGHTLWLLHRELTSSDRLLAQFEFKIFAMPNTYSCLLKFHIYLGLLLLFSLLLGSRIDVTTSQGTFLTSSFSII